jgi:Alw26I/Eco31I/Esp3I family type II restriction m6 adenine DNA methyltransferase
MEIAVLSRSLAKNYATFDEIFSYLKSSIDEADVATNKISFKDLGFSLTADETVELIGTLYEIFLKTGGIDDVRKQRDFGIYFTNGILSDLITQDALNQLSFKKIPKFLEPAAGMGSFVFAYIRNIFSYLEKPDADHKFTKQEIINSIYIVEKDETSANTLLWLINSYLAIKYEEKLSFPTKNLHVGDAIINSSTGESENLIERFNMDSTFDLIITNPPYRLLKASHSDSKELRNEINALKNLTNSVSYFGDITGVGNMYKMFVCKIFHELISTDGVVGLVIPRSLLTDFQSTKLRKRLISSSKICNIYDVPEGSHHFKGIGQAFSLFTLVKGGVTENVNIVTPNEKGSFDASSQTTCKPIAFYSNISDELSLIPLLEDDAHFLDKLSKYPRVKHCPQIVNFRGELDITIDRAFICEEDSPYNFVQGANIGLFNLKQSGRFVSPEFFPRPKDKWIKSERIACQQISNAQQGRRLKWSLIPGGFVLGNSCNFIAIDSESIFQDKDPILTSYLLAVFNSVFMNRWFRLLSANNHVSNNEIANMPFVIPDMKKQIEIDFVVRKLLIKYTPDMHFGLEKILCEVFDINFDSSHSDLSKGNF